MPRRSELPPWKSASHLNTGYLAGPTPGPTPSTAPEETEIRRRDRYEPPALIPPNGEQQQQTQEVQPISTGTNFQMKEPPYLALAVITAVFKIPVVIGQKAGYYVNRKRFERLESKAINRYGKMAEILDSSSRNQEPLDGDFAKRELFTQTLEKCAELKKLLEKHPFSLLELSDEQFTELTEVDFTSSYDIRIWFTKAPMQSLLRHHTSLQEEIRILTQRPERRLGNRAALGVPPTPSTTRMIPGTPQILGSLGFAGAFIISALSKNPTSLATVTTLGSAAIATTTTATTLAHQGHKIFQKIRNNTRQNSTESAIGPHGEIQQGLNPRSGSNRSSRRSSRSEIDRQSNTELLEQLSSMSEQLSILQNQIKQQTDESISPASQPAQQPQLSGIHVGHNCANSKPSSSGRKS